MMPRRTIDDGERRCWSPSPLPVSRKRETGIGILAATLFIALTFGGRLQADEPTAPIAISVPQRSTDVDFAAEILPLLQKNCLACHHGREAEGGVELDSADSIRRPVADKVVVEPGKGEQSLLIRVAARQIKPVMPPPDNKVGAVPLTSEQLGLLRLWIDQGAKGVSKPAATTVIRRPLSPTFQPVLSMAMSADDELLACSRGTRLQIYDLRGPRFSAELIDPSVSAAGQNQADADLIRSLAFDRTGNLLASGGFRTVRIWKRPRAALVHRIDTGAVTRSLAISPDSKSLAVGSENGSVLLHSLDGDGKKPLTLTGHSGPVIGVLFSSVGALSVSTDKTLRRWNLADGTPAGKWMLPTETRCMALLDNGTTLALGDADGVIRVYPLTALNDAAGQDALPTPQSELKGHAKAITSLATANNLKDRLLSGSEDGRLRLWDTSSSTSLRELSHDSPVHSIAFRDDGQRCVSVGANGARLWNVVDGAQLAEIKGDERPRREVIRADGAVFYAKACVEYRKRDLREAEESLKRETGVVEGANKAKEMAEKMVAEKSAAAEKAIAARAAAEQKAAEALATLKVATARAEKQAAETSLAQATQARAGAERTSQEANRAAEDARNKAQGPEREAKEAKNMLVGATNFIATADAVLQRAKAAVPAAQQAVAMAESLVKEREANKQRLSELAASSVKPLHAVSFSADGRSIALGAQDGTVILVDSEQGGASEHLSSEGGPVSALATGVNGRMVVANGSQLSFWSVTSDWKLLRTIGGENQPDQLADRVLTVDFSPDGQLLATGGGVASVGGELKLWRVADGTLVRQIGSPHRDTIHGVRFSPDGQTLATASADRMVKIFRVADGQLLQTLPGHTQHVLGVAWSPDGRTLASCGSDQVIKIWNLETGTALRTLRGDTYRVGEYRRAVTSLSFVGNTDHLVASSGDRTIRLHRSGGMNDVRAFLNGNSYFHAAVATSDGKWVIGGGQDGVLHFWNGENGYRQFSFGPDRPDQPAK